MTASSHSGPVGVCFVSPKAYPLFDPDADGVIGGAEVDLYLLATELAKDEKYRVSCITADYGQPAEQKIENVTVIKSLNFKQNQITGAAKIWKAMKKANADVYMIKTASPGVPLAAVFCRLNGRKFFYRTAHQRETDGGYIREHFFLGRAFAWSLRRASMVFAQNVDDVENYKRTLAIEAVVIPNGHRLTELGNAQKKSVLWVGRSADVKKPYRFLDLAEKIPDEKFTMICQPATGDNDYGSLVEKANQIENLEFHKSVPFKDIDKFFVNAKILVNTSDSEGFPNTFIQAAKAETAILSYTVNPDDFLDKYSCGIAANADVNCLSEQLTKILQNNRYKEMGINAKKYFLEKHDIGRIVGQYKDYFCQLLENKDGKR